MSPGPNVLLRRPRVICHMAVSIDGRVVVDGWPASVAAAVRRQYELVHESYEADGWICGRVTMEPFAGGVRAEVDVAREHTGRAPREDFRAPGDFGSFAIAIDPSGRLAWESNDIGGDHIVAVLSERVSDEYLAFLRERGVSYLLAGARDPLAGSHRPRSAQHGQTLDLALALRKIADHFAVRTLMLEGGGRINGSMMAAGLIDEVSVVVAPVVDGRVGTPALFDLDGDNEAGGAGSPSSTWSDARTTCFGCATALIGGRKKNDRCSGFTRTPNAGPEAAQSL